MSFFPIHSYVKHCRTATNQADFGLHLHYNQLGTVVPSMNLYFFFSSPKTQCHAAKKTQSVNSILKFCGQIALESIDTEDIFNQVKQFHSIQNLINKLNLMHVKNIKIISKNKRPTMFFSMPCLVFEVKMTEATAQRKVTNSTQITGTFIDIQFCYTTCAFIK